MGSKPTESQSSINIKSSVLTSLGPTASRSVALDGTHSHTERSGGFTPTTISGRLDARQTTSSLTQFGRQISAGPPVSPLDVLQLQAARAPQSIIQKPSRKVVSLVAFNRGGFVEAVSRARVSDVSSWMSLEVGLCSERIAKHKGVVDLLSADRVFGSFGAARQCVVHRQAAVRCAHSVAHSDAKTPVAATCTVESPWNPSGMIVFASSLQVADQWRSLSAAHSRSS